VCYYWIADDGSYTMASPKNISDVFKTVGQPTVTYVKRNNGYYEGLLRRALDERGQLCLITGPSKTGKTSLYREVLSARKEIPLVIRCDKNTKADAIWKQGLESVDFERAETRSHKVGKHVSVEGEASGKLGWKWLAGISAKGKGSIKKETSEEQVRKKILAEAGPDLLIPILQNSNYVLIIEDFHYISDDEKVLLFQQWKRFIDNEITVLVLGTTHRATDIANSNKDLIGRITQIDVGNWSDSDLKQICSLGFNFLHVPASFRLAEIIATEAAGLPIIVQQACLDLFTSQGIQAIEQLKGKEIQFDEHSVKSSLNNVARERYAQMEQYYNTLIKGPREKARKYRTYELVLACFTLNPISFKLSRNQIDERMRKLKIQSSEIPPAASVNSTLGALRSFQERRGFELLEWNPSEQVLYILEPVFLFYVRWRQLPSTQPSQLDMFESLLSKIRNEQAVVEQTIRAWMSKK
jgi:AAA ATPase domain